MKTFVQTLDKPGVERRKKVILNACTNIRRMVDENTCKICEDKQCRHAGEPTTKERISPNRSTWPLKEEYQMIRNEEMKALCIAGEMSNKELAQYFGVATTEIYAWRSNNNLTIPKCEAIRAGKVVTGKRTAEAIKAEMLKVQKAKKDAEKKAKRAEDRLKVLLAELKEAK